MKKYMEKILLIVSHSTMPPSKKELANPNAKIRYPWNRTFELLSMYFCKSNALNKNHDAIINLFIKNQTRLIYINGEKLRYLAPSLRSIGSLIAKGSNLKINDKEWIQSTPGIFHLTLSDYSKNIIDIPSIVSLLSKKKSCKYEKHFVFNTIEISNSELIRKYYHFLREIYYNP